MCNFTFTYKKSNWIQTLYKSMKIYSKEFKYKNENHNKSTSKCRFHKESLMD